MLIETLSVHNVLIVASALSLCWFAVGVLAGMRLQERRANGPSSSEGSGSANEAPTELYVGNLSYDLRGRDLSKVFQQYGRVVSARIIKNRSNGKSKGFGFVEMARHKDADAAVKALDGKEVQGRKLVVNEAKSRARP